MFKEKVKALIAKEKETDSKKKIENLVVFILILVITIIAINTIWNGKKDNTSSEKQQETEYGKQLATTSPTANTVSNTTNTIEQNLEAILSNIEGVGKVKVLVTYSESSEVVGMYNENNKDSSIEEKDTSGGTRITQQKDSSKEIIYKEVNGEKIPITQKVINPKVEGAIITAIGANNATVKNNIIQAVEAVTGLATHKIQVFEMKKE